MAGLSTATMLPAAAPTVAWATGSGRTQRSVSVTTNTTTTTTTTTILVLQLCAQEDVASFIASLNVFPHAAANVNKLCKP